MTGAAGALLLCLVAASAAAEPQLRCQRARLRAVRRAVEDRVACEVRALASAEPVEIACLVRAADRLAGAFARAGDRGTCPGTADQERQAVGDFVGQVRLRVPGAGDCAAAALRAAGTMAAGRIRCAAPADLDPAEVTACLQRTEARFRRAIADAGRDPACDPDAGTVASLAALLAREVVLRLRGPLPTTTTTTLPHACGDGVLAAGEACDGQPFCTPDCTLRVVACCLLPPGAAEACVEFVPLPSHARCLACIGAGGSCVRGACAGAACVDEPFAATSFCCQIDGACLTDAATSLGGVGVLYDRCLDAGGALVAGRCAVGGGCRPEP